MRVRCTRPPLRAPIGIPRSATSSVGVPSPAERSIAFIHEAVERRDYVTAREAIRSALAIDPENVEALCYENVVLAATRVSELKGDRSSREIAINLERKARLRIKVIRFLRDNPAVVSSVQIDDDHLDIRIGLFGRYKNRVFLDIFEARRYANDPDVKRRVIERIMAERRSLSALVAVSPPPPAPAPQAALPISAKPRSRAATSHSNPIRRVLTLLRDGGMGYYDIEKETGVPSGVLAAIAGGKQEGDATILAKLRDLVSNIK